MFVHVRRQLQIQLPDFEVSQQAGIFRAVIVERELSCGQLPDALAVEEKQVMLLYLETERIHILSGKESVLRARGALLDVGCGEDGQHFVEELWPCVSAGGRQIRSTAHLPCGTRTPSSSCLIGHGKATWGPQVAYGFQLRV